MTTAQAKSWYRWAGVDRTTTGREKSGATFKVGDLIIIDSAGQWDLAAASGANFASTAGRCALALSDATGTANTTFRVGLFDDESKLYVPVNHATPASAVTAVTLADETYVLKNDASLGWSVMIDTSTNPVVRIQEIPLQFVVGEQYGIVGCGIIAAVRFTA